MSKENLKLISYRFSLLAYFHAVIMTALLPVISEKSFV